MLFPSREIHFLNWCSFINLKRGVIMEIYLAPSYFIDSDTPSIVAFAHSLSKEDKTPLEKAISLYYGVRDGIRYNPYLIEARRSCMQASYILEKKEGYCVNKAVVLAACARGVGIPARLGFADVKNHLVTGRLRAMMGTDLFVWHGYTEFYLEGKWVKATPAFNLELCQAFGVKPLAFDGKNDSIFHPFDVHGNRHMEYVNDHGSFGDLPFDTMINAYVQAYPRYFELAEFNKKGTAQGFKEEAERENL